MTKFNELHEAAGKKDGFKTVVSLVNPQNKNKKYINQQHSELGTRPIHFAAESGSLETLRFLIEECDVDLDSSEVDFDNLLYYASQNNQDVIDYITAPENKIIEEFNDGTTYFHAAICAGRIEEVETSLNNDPELALTANNKDDTPLAYAQQYRRHDIGKLLVEHLCKFLSSPDQDVKGIVNDIKAYINDLYQDDFLDQAFETMDVLTNAYDQIDQNKSFNYSVKFFCSFTLLALGKYKFEFANTNLEMAEMFALQINSDDHLKRRLNQRIQITKKQLNLGLVAKDRGYVCKDVADDGECFYTALVDQLELATAEKIDQASLRSLAARHISANSESYKSFFRYNEDQDREFAHYISKITLPDTWADQYEIFALSRELNMTFVILADDENENLIVKRTNPKATLYFGYLRDLHYQSLHCCVEMDPIKSIDEEIDAAEDDLFDGVILSDVMVAELVDEPEASLLDANEKISVGMRFTTFSSRENNGRTKIFRTEEAADIGEGIHARDIDSNPGLDVDLGCRF